MNSYTAEATVSERTFQPRQIRIDRNSLEALTIDFDNEQKPEESPRGQRSVPQTSNYPRTPGAFRLTVSGTLGFAYESLGTALTFVPEDPNTLSVRRFNSTTPSSISFCGAAGRCVYRESDKLTDHFSGGAFAGGLIVDPTFVHDDIDIGATIGFLWSHKGAYQWYGGPRIAKTIRNWRCGIAIIGGTIVYTQEPSGPRVVFSEPAYGAVEAAQGSAVEARIGLQGGLRLDIEYLLHGQLGPIPLVSGGIHPTFFADANRHWAIMVPFSFGVGFDVLRDEPIATPKKEASP